MKLLIVESPAKCKKIQGFLGEGWRVQATMGHIRALKEDLAAIGFNPAAGATQVWCPTYEPIDAKRDAIASLRKLASSSDVYLGSDDDREGEAIAWHVCQLLGLDPKTTPRVVFHEITEAAIRAAVARPRRIDMSKVNAQQARSMLDMLIGFTLSPCLWRGVGQRPGLSAGRCQTPALRIIYDRDREIESHAATNSWRFSVVSEDIIEDSTLEWRDATVYPSLEAVQALLTPLTTPKTLTITQRQERVSTSQPPKPFITSSLQQEASSRLSIAPKSTMKAAQTLYEAGYITYMRTDNPILSQEAIDAASAIVTTRWGEEYLGGVMDVSGGGPVVKKKVTAKKKTATAAAPEAQAAHEGIRPTHMDVDNGAELEGMGANERRLYDLIWRRTIQAVMTAEQRDVVKLSATLTYAAGSPPSPLVTTEWDQVRFAGWKVLDQDSAAVEHAAGVFEARADLQVGVTLDWESCVGTEVRSTPAARYTEASLIRELEHRGIGRPSTYATLVETVVDRAYVEKATIPAQPVTLRTLTLTAAAKAPKLTERKEKLGGEKDKLRTTALGRTVIEWLNGQFSDMIEYDFTALMETQLDEVAKGAKPWESLLTDTWSRYADRYSAIMTVAGGGAAAGGGGDSTKQRDFGEGYKMVVSKKGPLFVLEQPEQKTRFATVPAHLSLKTATLADAKAAFEATKASVEGTLLGDLDGRPVQVRKGPYGHYATWGDIKLNCDVADTLDTLTDRLRAKSGGGGDGVDHTVGPYRIKRGPYGLYMYKTMPAGSKTKPVFVSIPDSTAWSTLTSESAEALYTHSLTTKKEKRQEGGGGSKATGGSKAPAGRKKKAAE
jgi:DNA topoisomerase-1